MAEKIVLAQLDLDINSLLAATTQSKLAVTQLKDEILALKAAGEATGDGFAEMQQELAKMTKVLSSQISLLEEHAAQSKALAAEQQNVAKTANAAASAQQKLTQTYAVSEMTLEGFTETARSANEVLEQLNVTAQNNRRIMAEGEGVAKTYAGTFNGYKELFMDSAQSINIFNGSFGDFITRAQEAGGVGPLVTGAFNGMATGIAGMTKASLAFLATPLGMAIAAIAAVLSPVISYFKNTEEGMAKITAVTRPLQSVLSALGDAFAGIGKMIVGVFENPKDALISFAKMFKDNIVNRVTGLLELVPALGKAVGHLFSGEFSKAGKVAADAVGKVALGTENITDKVAGAASATAKYLADAYKRGQDIDRLQKQLDKGLADYTKRNSELKNELDKQNAVAGDTNKTFAEREAAAVKAIATAKEHSKLMVQRLDQELQLLKLKASQGGYTSAEKAEIAELVAKRNEALEQGANAEKAQTDKLNAIRKERNDKARQQRQDALNGAVTKMDLELQRYIQAEGDKTKTLSGQLKYAEEISAKKIALAEAEYKASAKSETDKMKLQMKRDEAQKEYLKASADATIEHARAEFEYWKASNKSILDGKKELTAELIAQENQRLEQLKQKQLELLAMETGTNAEIIAQKRATNQQLTVEDMTYLTKKQEIEEGIAAQQQGLKDAEAAQIEADKTKRAEEREAEYQKNLEDGMMKYEADRELEQQRYEDEKAEILARKEAELIDEATFIQLNEENEKKSSENKKALAKQEADFKLGLAHTTFGNMATILGKESAAGKAMAIAQTTIDTYQAAVAAYKSMVGMGPAGPAIAAAAAGAAIASGMANVKKIASTKAPKAERGALFSIGGRRHSAGGTLFTGEDGTAFEAEQGELIGVMNRNAARHFMAFNNAFPAGGATAPNYFASGGIVSREIASPALNTDELAAKIALANSAMPAPVVSVQDIITEGNSYVQVKNGANF